MQRPFGPKRRTLRAAELSERSVQIQQQLLRISTKKHGSLEAREPGRDLVVELKSQLVHWNAMLTQPLLLLFWFRGQQLHAFAQFNKKFLWRDVPHAQRPSSVPSLNGSTATWLGATPPNVPESPSTS